MRCPTLILRPGSIEQAHQPDEFIELKYIKPTIELLTSFAPIKKRSIFKFNSA